MKMDNVELLGMLGNQLQHKNVMSRPIDTLRIRPKGPFYRGDETRIRL